MNAAVRKALPLLLIGITHKVFAKEGSNAPKSGKADDRIDDPGNECALTTKEPCHKVKLK